jgi:phage recombination protein Bet
MTETSLAVVDEKPDQLTTQGHWTNLDAERKALLRDTVCRGATDAEFELAVAQVNRLMLDPFTGQIFFIKRFDRQLGRETMAIQVSIDGLRLIADRSKQYMGQTEPQWCGPDGKWVDVWTSDSPPAAARAGVYRKGFEQPIYAVARYQSYVQRKRNGSPNATWDKMPEVMLHKCAEALALRKGFPNELSGIYSTDDGGAADDNGQSPPVRSQPSRVVEGHNPDDAKALEAFRERIEAVKTPAELQDLAPMAANLPETRKGNARYLWRNAVERLRDTVEPEPESEAEPAHDAATGEVLEDPPDYLKTLPPLDPAPPADDEQATQEAFGYNNTGDR